MIRTMKSEWRTMDHGPVSFRVSMSMVKVLTLTFVVLLTMSEVTGQAQTQPKVNYRLREKQVLDQILGGTYDNQIRPSGGNGTAPTHVEVNLFLRSISKIDDDKMEYSVQMTLREEWKDQRLKFQPFIPGNNHSYLTLTDTSRVWMPDLFFSNENSGQLHHIIKPNAYIRISPDGHVLFSIRATLTLACPMVLTLYPMDKQTCHIQMASYGWTTEDLIFRWKPGDSVQVTPKLRLPRFSLQQLTTSTCDTVTNTGSYSCLLVSLHLKREFGYFLIQVFLPCIILVIVSWVSFWLDPTSVPARVALGITTLLTMSTQTIGVSRSAPPVSYIKALDIWNGACLAFVFGALLEYAFVNYLSRRDKILEAMRKDRGEVEQTCCGGLWVTKFRSRSKRVDLVSRLVFPSLFIMFNVAYWCAYLI